MSEQARTLPADFLHACDFQARKAVCAMAYNPKTKREEIVGFKFNPMIADWPICQDAEAEGWGRELRSAMIATVKRMMFAGEAPDPARAIPSEKWIADTRRNAERFRKAAEARGDAPAGRSTFKGLSGVSIRMTGEQPE